MLSPILPKIGLEKKQDKLFLDPDIEPEFQFTPKVAEVFDDMLGRSVPCYRQIIEMMAQIIAKFLEPNELVYDLGCSTGATMLELARRLEQQQLRFVGIDNSNAMIEKASLKAELYCKEEQLTFVEGDLLKTDLDQAGAIIVNYTLQFIRPLLRQGLVEKLYRALRPGGILIISEKVLSPDPVVNRAYIDFYLDFKRSQGYSEIEIAKKREALENVLVPFTIAENEQLLNHTGFSSCETFFQWFNFVSLVAIK